MQLTPREHSIARLVVQGLTNRETASRLLIAEQPVQYHLTKIYAKFTIRSRTELAHVHPDSEESAGAASWSVDSSVHNN